MWTEIEEKILDREMCIISICWCHSFSGISIE